MADAPKPGTPATPEQIAEELKPYFAAVDRDYAAAERRVVEELRQKDSPTPPRRPA